jgi:hypothetical protein
MGPSLLPPRCARHQPAPRQEIGSTSQPLSGVVLQPPLTLVCQQTHELLQVLEASVQIHGAQAKVGSSLQHRGADPEATVALYRAGNLGVKSREPFWRHPHGRETKTDGGHLRCARHLERRRVIDQGPQARHGLDIGVHPFAKLSRAVAEEYQPYLE